MIEEVATTVTDTVAEWDSEPLVPVTVTVYLPGVEEETLSVDEAEPPEDRVTLVGLSDTARPDGEADAESVTVPENPLRLARLIEGVAGNPDWTERVGGLLEIVKSG